MLKNKPHFFTILLILACLASPARAQEMQDMSSMGGNAVMEDVAQAVQAPADPLVVADVLVDVTAENAVKAREAAIVQARRDALSKLAERNLTAQDFAAFQMPDDKTIGRIVKDFEIRDEQLSATRYVAIFTVSFSESVRHFVPVPAAMPQPTPFVQLIPPSTSGRALILPYLEQASGRTLLWEEDNLWRVMWQNAISQGTAGTQNFVAPLGDLTDIASGPAEAIWAGKYDALDNLMQNHQADSALVLVAGLSSGLVQVDVYAYQGGVFERRGQVVRTLYDGVDDTQALTTALEATVQYLTDPVAGQAEAVQNANTSAPMMTGQGTAVEASMAFDSFATWMETQKKLSDMRPPVRVDIRNISKTGARFTLTFNGEMDIFLRVLADQGLALVQEGDGYILQAIHSN